MKAIGALLTRILGLLGKKIWDDGIPQAVAVALSDVGSMLVAVTISSELSSAERSDLYATSVNALKQAIDAALDAGVLVIDDIPALLLDVASEEIKSVVAGI